VQIRKYPVFYQKVWKVVSQIPKGQVRTYAWVARGVGSPKAYRAVGQALKNNPFPGIIPCHRVIRSDGKLGGYSRGIRFNKVHLEKKKLELLLKEGFTLRGIKRSLKKSKEDYHQASSACRRGREDTNPPNRRT